MSRARRVVALVAAALLLIVGVEVAASMSALQRSLTSSASALSTGLVAYWPLDERPGASAGSPVSGVDSGSSEGPKRVTFGQQGPDGSAGAVLLVTGDSVLAVGTRDGLAALTLPIPDHTAGELVLAYWFQGSPFTETSGTPTDADLVTAESWVNFRTGTIGSVVIRFTEAYPYVSASSSYVTADAWSGRNTNGSEIGSEINTTTAGIRIFDGAWHQVQLRMAQSGADVSMSLYLDGTQYSSQTLSTQTLGKASELQLATAGGVSGATLTTPNTVFRAAQVTFHNDTAVSATTLYDAGHGYPGETGTARFARLCTEAGVAYNVAT